MRIRTVLTRDRELGDSQTMTPMIDIVFLLLVFFVCVATDRVVEYNLPTELASGTVQAQPPLPRETWVTEIRVLVTQSADSRQAIIEMNGRRFEDYTQFQQTLQALANVSRDSPVILDITEQVRLGDVIRIYDAARAAEFQSIHFAMKASELNPS